MAAPPTVAVLRGHTGFDPDNIAYQARNLTLPTHLCAVCSQPATVEVNCRLTLTDPDDWSPSCDRCAVPPLACAWPDGCNDIATQVRATPHGHFPSCPAHAGSGEHYPIVEPFYRRFNAWVEE